MKAKRLSQFVEMLDSKDLHISSTSINRLKKVNYHSAIKALNVLLANDTSFYIDEVQVGLYFGHIYMMSVVQSGTSLGISVRIY